MSIPADNAVDRYVGDTITVSHPYNFSIAHAGQLVARQDSFVMTYGTHYLLTGVGDTDGGTVNWFTPPGLGVKVTISRSESNSQETTYVANEAYDGLKVQRDFNHVIRVTQMLEEQITRAPKFAIQSSYAYVEIDDPVPLQFLRWSSDLQSIESAIGVDVGSLSLALTAGGVVFATSAASLDTDSAFTWDDTAKRLIIGVAGVLDTAVRDSTRAFIQTAVAPIAGVESGLSVQLSNAGSPAEVSAWKFAIIGQGFTSVDTGSFAADVSGVVGQGKIVDTDDGRVIAGVFEGYIEDAADDGLVIALEAGILNTGTVELNPNSSLKPKINLWLADHGPNKITAGIAFAETQNGWHFGAYMRNIHDSFVLMETPLTTGANGINIKNHANWGIAMVIPNAVPISAWTADGLATRNLMFMSAGDSIAIGQDASVAEVVIFGGTSERITADPTGIGFYGTAPVAKPTVTGSRGSNDALTSLLSALASQGLITDSSS